MVRKPAVTKKKVKRRNIRFSPDQGDLAWILTDHKGKFRDVPLPALLLDESYSGCSIVIAKNSQFSENSEIHVKVGSLDPLKASIRWIKEFEGRVLILGLSYIDS
ncbi:MAG: hypothetical protein ACK5Y2_13430 [Bdellovibrionales bacterium]